MTDSCFKIWMTAIREYEGPLDKSTGGRLGYLLKLR
jgi:hypothetical protein